MAEQRPRIGFIGFGEVGSLFASLMRERGAQVVAYDLVRDKVRGVEFVALPELVAGCDWILSTVTTQAACEVAKACQAWLGPAKVYLDLNSTSPDQKREIGRIVVETRAGFAEGAILGAIGAEGAAVRILLGGPQGRAAAEMLSSMGFRAEFFSEEIGQASLFKMLRSVFSKGMEALLLETLAAAQRAGLAQLLWQDLIDFMQRNPFERAASSWICTHPRACERRYHELRQVNQTLRELGLRPLVELGVEAFFERSRGLKPEQAFRAKPTCWEDVTAWLAQRLCGS